LTLRRRRNLLNSQMVEPKNAYPKIEIEP